MIKPTIVNMKFGSHLYGLSTPDSDVDYKGIYIPQLRDLVLCQHKEQYQHSTGGSDSKNSKYDTDIEVFALDKFLQLALRGETVAIDMLHCEQPLITSDVWEDLVAKRAMFYSKNLKSFVGYVRRQAAKYGIKGSRLNDIEQAIESVTRTPKHPSLRFEPLRLDDIWEELFEGQFAQRCAIKDDKTRETRYYYQVNGKLYQNTMTTQQVAHALRVMRDKYGDRAKLAAINDGVDWKAVSHALRAGYQARDIYTKGDFTYPLDETPMILAVKQGRLDFKTEVAPVLEELVDEVEKLSEASSLPESVDKKYWEEWLIDIYSTWFKLPTLTRRAV